MSDRAWPELLLIVFRSFFEANEVMRRPCRPAPFHFVY